MLVDIIRNGSRGKKRSSNGGMKDSCAASAARFATPGCTRLTPEMAAGVVAVLDRRLNAVLKVADQTRDEVIVSWDQIKRSELAGRRLIERRRVLSWRLR